MSTKTHDEEDQQEGDSYIECPACLTDNLLSDILTDGAYCQWCWVDLSSHMGMLEEDSRKLNSDVLLAGIDETLCCELPVEECKCEFPEKAPSFDEAMDKYLGELPEDIYADATEVPCLSRCSRAWNPSCIPLREALHKIHMHKAYLASGADDIEELYIGSIDGCIDVVKEYEDTYVREITVRIK